METHVITRLYDDGGEPRFADTDVSFEQELLVRAGGAAADGGAGPGDRGAVGQGG
jgi:hypothetical protein